MKLPQVAAIRIVGVNDPAVQVFADGVAGQARAPGDLPDGHSISQAPPPDYTQ
jgi:hypothetical protein